MFTDDFQIYKGRISKHLDKIADMTEEATKNALIMPFLVLLGGEGICVCLFLVFIFYFIKKVFRIDFSYQLNYFFKTESSVIKCSDNCIMIFRKDINTFLD